MVGVKMNDTTRIRRVLESSELFNILPSDNLDKIVPYCSYDNYEEGDVIFFQGQRMEKVYIIDRGSIALTRYTRSKQADHPGGMTTEIIGQGRFIGWSTLVDPNISTLSAYARTATDIVSIDGRALRLILADNHPMDYVVLRKLVEILSQRLRVAYSIIDSVL